MIDIYDLGRFVVAQDHSGTYERAVNELRQGEKKSHWMWFVFPQVAGLGHSPTSKRYEISSLGEAQAYVLYSPLGDRLLECSSIVAETVNRSAEQIFGEVDAQKLRSSMTLFSHADPLRGVFRQVIDRHFDGVPDAATGLLI